MKVTNLTDKATPALAQRGLVGVSIRAGDRTVRPGETLELKLSPAQTAELGRYVVCGALWLGEPPRGYPRLAETEPAPPPTPSIQPAAMEPVMVDKYEWSALNPDASPLVSEQELEEPTAPATKPKKKRKRR